MDRCSTAATPRKLKDGGGTLCAKSRSAACAAAAATLPVVVHDKNVEWYTSWRKTMTKALEVENSAFLNQYDEAFTTFDGDQIAALYCIPTITMRGDGSIHTF